MYIYKTFKWKIQHKLVFRRFIEQRKNSTVFTQLLYIINRKKRIERSTKWTFSTKLAFVYEM